MEESEKMNTKYREGGNYTNYKIIEILKLEIINLKLYKYIIYVDQKVLF